MLVPRTLERDHMIPRESFRQSLGQSESGGDYNARNSEGFVGKYQFGPDRLTDFMVSTGKKFSMAQFQNNPALQEEVQGWHEDDILSFVASQGLDQYIGKQVGGVVISPESMLSMAHLGGKAGMKKFIETGGEYNPADSNGTTLSDYGQKIPSKEASSSTPQPITPQPSQVAEKDAGFTAAVKGLLEKPVIPRTASLTPPGTFRKGGRMSPLTRNGIETALPGQGMIETYSTPGGLGSLKRGS